MWYESKRLGLHTKNVNYLYLQGINHDMTYVGISDVANTVVVLFLLGPVDNSWVERLASPSSPSQHEIRVFYLVPA